MMFSGPGANRSYNYTGYTQLKTAETRLFLVATAGIVADIWAEDVKKLWRRAALYRHQTASAARRCHYRAACL
jgi:hypothetical protein